MKFGYVRVSSIDQNESRQIIAMNEIGISENRIFIDKQSGKDFDRPQYKKMLQTIQRGDLLCMLSIDRLGRNYNEIQEQWRLITKEIGADIHILDMPLLNTRQNKDLLGTFVADLVLQVLSFAAHNERDNIRRRQAEGIAAAKARGVHMGRPRKMLPKDFYHVMMAYKMGNLSLDIAAQRLGISKSTFYRWCRDAMQRK